MPGCRQPEQALLARETARQEARQDALVRDLDQLRQQLQPGAAGPAAAALPTTSRPQAATAAPTTGTASGCGAQTEQHPGDRIDHPRLRPHRGG